MKRDYSLYIKRCDRCYKFSKVSQKHPEPLPSSETSCPFHKWGIDLLGLFPSALGQDKPLASIATEKIKKFVWKKIIWRYDIPRELITDNGTQFTDKRFREFYSDLNIQQLFSIEHRRTNGLAGATNKVILTGLRKKLD
ncbi:hypothetical protein Cni_G02573 [Canna indica]|uniref:Integrase catalytic domain-containing protein n=1 Tax=Canna indica TaxID=4628 RepID=A0AAQ3JRH5_9LILI|nr:hypothetical protein Cni_G02573 [Canna indica]